MLAREKLGTPERVEPGEHTRMVGVAVVRPAARPCVAIFFSEYSRGRGGGRLPTMSRARQDRETPTPEVANATTLALLQPQFVLQARSVCACRRDVITAVRAGLSS